MAIGQFDQLRFHHRLVGQAMALQLDIETVAESLFEPFKPHFCQITLALGERAIQQAFRTATENNQTIRLCHQVFKLDMGSLTCTRLHIGARRQTDQLGITAIVGRNDDQ